jgi:CubicO group peptidase (beta-lactamase class C family)
MIGHRQLIGSGLFGLAAMMPRARSTPIRLEPVKIDAVFKAYTRATPGCALGIYHDGRIVYSKGYGMAELNLGVPISPGTMFDIGSTSKQFAAASTVLLANEGKISLSDDIRKYIPELPDYGTTITIDHLLRHTSGLRDYNGLLFMKGFRNEDVTDDDDALAIIVRQRNLNFKPGTKWDYSNTGFFLLSVIVKRVSGKTLAQFAKERLFDPLGMPRTNFRDDHNALLAGRAVAYDPVEKGGGAGGGAKYQIDMSSWDQLGDGAVNTNVIELVKWDENFYTGQVGGRALIDRLTERGTLVTGDSLQYARGLFVDQYRGVRRVHHGGAWAGYRAMLMRFPNQHLSVATLCNRSDANTTQLAEGVADVVLADVFKAAESKIAKSAAKPEAVPSGSTGELGAYVGVYFSDTAQSVIRIGQVGGHLTLGFSGLTLPLKPLGGGRFETEHFPVRAEFAGDDMTFYVSNEKQGVFRKVTAVTPSAADIAAIVGSYYSPELDTVWEIVMKDGKPNIKARAFGYRALEPAIVDGYNAGPGFILITRDGSGRITGFDFSASRMQRIRFDRR